MATSVLGPRGGLKWLALAVAPLLLPSVHAGKHDHKPSRPDSRASSKGKSPWPEGRTYIAFTVSPRHSAYSTMQWNGPHPAPEALPDWFREDWCRQSIYTIQSRLPTRDKPLFLLAFANETAVDLYTHLKRLQREGLLTEYKLENRQRHTAPTLLSTADRPGRVLSAATRGRVTQATTSHAAEPPRPETARRCPAPPPPRRVQPRSHPWPAPTPPRPPGQPPPAPRTRPGCQAPLPAPNGCSPPRLSHALLRRSQWS